MFTPFFFFDRLVAFKARRLFGVEAKRIARTARGRNRYE